MPSLGSHHGRGAAGATCLRLSLLGASLLAGAAAEAPPAAKDGKDPKTGRLVEEVVVTAQRRNEKLQRVPVSVSSYTSKQRDRYGIRSIQDFADRTPGVAYSSTLDRLSIRGIGRLTNTLGSDPGVATYNDGFYTASTVEASKTPMFVNRVEFLRGPQGTLFGRNSVGGAINIISNRPSDHVEGQVRTTIEDYTGSIVEGYVAGPIAGNLKGRLSFQYGPNSFNSIFKNANSNDTKGLHRWLGEAQLQYDFDDGSQIWAKYAKSRWDDQYTQENFVDAYNKDVFFPAGSTVPNPAFQYDARNPAQRDPRRTALSTLPSDQLTGNHTAVVKARIVLDGAELRYTGGYETYRYNETTDYDQTGRTSAVTDFGTDLGPYSFNPQHAQDYGEDKQYWSNELILANTGPSRFNYLLGLYHFHEDFYQPVSWYLAGRGDDDQSRAFLRPIAPDGGPSAANPHRDFYRGTGRLRTDSYAAFAQVDYAILPRLKLTLGARYSQDVKDGFETFRLIYWNPTDPDPACGRGCGAYTPAVDVTGLVTGVGDGRGPVARSLSRSWGGPSARASLDYTLNENTLLYAAYNRGIKAGGFNLGNYSQRPTVDQESVDAFEVGVKAQPTPALTLNAAGYYYNYANAQIPLFVNQTGVQVENFFNIPEITSKGVELEAAWLPLSWLELNASYAFADARITAGGGRYIDTASATIATPQSLEGNRVPQSSQHQVAVSGLIDVPISYGDLFLAGSFVYRSSAYYGVFTNNPNYRAPGWNQVDLRVTWVSPSRRLTLIGYVKNLFDSFGYDGVVPGGGTTATGFGRSFSYTLPRRLGVEAQLRF